MSEPLLRPALPRVIGPVGLAIATLNVMIGGGIYRAPAAADALAGPLAPLTYLLSAGVMACAIGCMLIARDGSERSGGPYAWVHAALGPNAAFALGVTSTAGLLLGAAAVSAVFADTMGVLFPLLSGRVGRLGLLALLYAFLAWVNLRGVRSGHRTNVAFGVVKILPLLLVIGLALWFAGTPGSGAAPTIGDTSAFGSIIAASSVVIFLFAGVEMVLIPSGEIRNPSRTLSLGIGAGWILLTLVLTGVHLACSAMLGDALATSEAPVLEAVRRAGIPGGEVAVLLGTCVSAVGCIGGVVLAVPRLIQAMAADGLLPGRLATIDARTRAPSSGIVIAASLAFVLAATNGFEALVSLVSLACILGYMLSSLAAFRRSRVLAAKAFSIFTLALLCIVALATPVADIARLLGLLAGAFLLRRISRYR